MTSVVIAALISLVTTLVLTPVVRRSALRSGAVDEPGGRRVHSHVTPRLGGISVLAGFFAPLALFSVLQTGAMRGVMTQPRLVIALVVGSLIVGVVGAVDDVRGLGPWPKLFAQTVAATVAYTMGYRIDDVNLPIVGEIHIGALSPFVTVFWFLAITNAINLIDGLDGLASGMTLFATLFNFAAGYFNESPLVMLLSASLGGAVLGFLRYNFNPATIFLGDAGSMFLGFALAATSIAGATTKSSTAIAILAPIIALGIPIMDTFLAMVRRTVARQSIFSADRGHIHHQLLDLGITHRRVVLILYMGSIALTTAALGVAFGRSWQYGGALVLTCGVLFVFVRAATQAQRASRPIVDESERILAMKALDDRVAKALPAIKRCADREAVERCLSELGADKRLIAAISIEPEDDAITDTVELVYPLRYSHDVLRVKLSAALGPLADEVTIRFIAVAELCSVVLRQQLPPAGSSELATAE